MSDSAVVVKALVDAQLRVEREEIRAWFAANLADVGSGALALLDAATEATMAWAPLEKYQPYAGWGDAVVAYAAWRKRAWREVQQGVRECVVARRRGQKSPLFSTSDVKRHIETMSDTFAMQPPASPISLAAPDGMAFDDDLARMAQIVWDL